MKLNYEELFDLALIVGMHQQHEKRMLEDYKASGLTSLVEIYDGYVSKSDKLFRKLQHMLEEVKPKEQQPRAYQPRQMSNAEIEEILAGNYVEALCISCNLASKTVKEEFKNSYMCNRCAKNHNKEVL